MKTLRMMDSTGDTVLKFDGSQAMMDKAAIEARDLFDRVTKKGAAVFAINRGGGKTDKRVKDFSELEQDNVIIPAIIGG